MNRCLICQLCRRPIESSEVGGAVEERAEDGRLVGRLSGVGPYTVRRLLRAELPPNPRGIRRSAQARLRRARLRSAVGDADFGRGRAARYGRLLRYVVSGKENINLALRTASGLGTGSRHRVGHQDACHVTEARAACPERLG